MEFGEAHKQYSGLLYLRFPIDPYHKYILISVNIFLVANDYIHTENLNKQFRYIYIDGEGNLESYLEQVTQCLPITTIRSLEGIEEIVRCSDAYLVEVHSSS